ncbi:MAG: hypothetical protein AB7K52_12950 [Phycisphaerales bacterium]
MAANRFTLEWAELVDGPADSTVAGPTPDDLRAILGVLVASESGFVILSCGDERYIQAAAGAEPGEPLIIEYRDGDADRHFQIDEEVFDAARTTELFTTYLRDPASIGAAAAWARIEV